MGHTAIDILILLFGCASFMGILIFALTYRETKIKAAITKQDDSGWFIMNAYQDSVKAERERQLNKPDRLLGVMQDFFVELRKRDEANDKTS